MIALRVLKPDEIPIPVPKTLSVSEVAAMMNVHRATVCRLIERGDLAAFRFGKQIRVIATDLDRIIHAPAYPPKGDA